MENRQNIGILFSNSIVYLFNKVDLENIASNVKEVEQWEKIMVKVCILPS